MFGTRPDDLKPPDLNNAARISIPNSPRISTQFCSQPFGTYIVEEIQVNDNYKVVVKKPDGKKVRGKLPHCPHQSDFTIWVFESRENYWMPKHLETLKAFHKLEQTDRIRLFDAIKKVIIDFKDPIEACDRECQKIYLSGYPVLLILSYLKWMAALEDIRYPPPEFLGRKMAFAGYVLVSSGLYKPEELQGVLKIW